MTRIHPAKGSTRVALTATLSMSLWFGTLPAYADGFVPVVDKATFLSHVSGRTLRLSMFDVWVAVNADGTIKGQAMGWDLTGYWAWDKGLFCRQMDWSGSEIPRNCQLVEVTDTDAIRFTVDGGQGRSATFKID